MTIQILQGDAVEQLKTLPDKSVHCVVTSTPYYGLRSYGTTPQIWMDEKPLCEKHDWTKAPPRRSRKVADVKDQESKQATSVGTQHDLPETDICEKCGAWRGELGLEPTPELFVKHIVMVFREVKRVLRDDGTLWLNLGDSYASGKGTCHNPGGGEGSLGRERKEAGCHPLDRGNKSTLSQSGLKPKDMIGIPWMVAFALRADGWYLRSDIIWSKPNPMPESVTDRPTKAHEYVFLLTKKAKYYYDADAIREPLQECSIERAKYGWNGTMVFNEKGKEEYRSQPDPVDKMGERWSPTSGRNRRTVWEIATQPTPEAHYATFPEALVEPCIKAGTSEYGCCPVCGKPWERISQKTDELQDGKIRTKSNKIEISQGNHGKTSCFKSGVIFKSQTIGWQPGCKCEDNKPVSCVVLDPFGGSGTTAKVARDLKRDAILIELNPAYISIAKERLRLNEQLVI